MTSFYKALGKTELIAKVEQFSSVDSAPLERLKLVDILTQLKQPDRKSSGRLYIFLQ